MDRNRLTQSVQRRTPLAVYAPQAVADGGESVEISSIFRLLYRRRGFIFTIMLVTFVVAMSAILLTFMRFASTARIYLGELEEKDHPGDHSGPNDIDVSPTGHGDIVSELEILKSRSLVTQAILGAGLNTTVTLPGWKPPRYWRWLLSRRSPSAIDVASREVRVQDAALPIESPSTSSFDVLFTADVDYEVRRAGVLVGHAKLGDLMSGDGVKFRVVAGTLRAPTSGARYTVKIDSLEDVVASVLKGLEVSTPAAKTATGDPAKVATLRFSDPSPGTAAAFLDHLISGYLNQRQAWKIENATAAESFITSELAKTRQKLDELQDNLAEYRSRSGVAVLDGESKVIIDQVGQYEQQEVAARLEVRSLSSLQDRLKLSSAPLEAHVVGEAKGDAVLTALATSLEQAQGKLAELQVRYNEAAPEVQNQKAQVESQLKAVRNYVGSRLARANSDLRALDGVLGGYEQKLKTVPGAQIGLARLTRETEVYSSMYSLLLRQQQATALTQASTISKNRVIDAPEVSYREDLGRLGLGLASAPAGLILGALLVIVRAMTSGRFQDEAEVLKLLGEFPILSTIPHLSRRKVAQAPASLEAFRTLRVGICDRSVEPNGQIVLLTSPCSSDGKTTCARFLAGSLAKAGKAVVVVDTGVKNGGATSAKQATGSEERGLAEVLTGSVPWHDVAHYNAAGPDCGFQSISGGLGGSTDLLWSPAMQDFLADLRQSYAYVIVEAPSYPAVSDALVLSALADVVVMIIRLEHTERTPALESARRISSVATRFGLVVNDAHA